MNLHDLPSTAAAQGSSVAAAKGAPSTLDRTERAVCEILRAASGAFVPCADLVAQLPGKEGPRRIGQMVRYVSSIRSALKAEGLDEIVTFGRGSGICYALRPVEAATPIVQAAMPGGFGTRKAVIVRALVEAAGAYLPVVDLCRLGFQTVDPDTLRRTRSLVNEIRSTLRTRGISAAILTQGVGTDLRYAWSDAPAATAAAEPNGEDTKGAVRITLPPLYGEPCFYDGDSLIVGGRKQERATPR